MATLVRPKILLLDEHTAALDPKTSDMVMNLTRKIVEEQELTTLMITRMSEDIGRGALDTQRSSTGRSCGVYRRENAGMSSEREVGILSAEYLRFPG